MNRSILFLILINLFSPLTAQTSGYSVSGGSGLPLLAENKSGLEVYLLNGLSDARITFTSTNQGTHQWYRYRESGYNAVPVPSIQNGNTSYITDVQNGYGYFVGLPTEALPLYVWIFDYSLYIPHFFDLEVEEDDDDKCEYLIIKPDAEAEPLSYFLSTGSPGILERIYNLQYDTQVWMEDINQFVPKEENKKYNDIYEILIPAPLADTHFTLSGDQFAEHFGLTQAIQTDLYKAIAVEAHGIAETSKQHADNEIHQAGETLGGSAPIEYTFTAYANEPVAAFYIWKILQQDSITKEMATIVRYPDKVLRYNFEKDGFYRVELEVIGGNGQPPCSDTPPPFDIIINNTVIRIPNAFSPGSSIGVNDELKISFSSVMSFKASVYNRQGNLLFQWNDPAKGWDGRVNGRFVPTGVYYVIVEYKDSLGKARSMSKAVNVLRSKNLRNETE